MTPIIISGIFLLFSALIATYVSYCLHRRHTKYLLKRDVLRRLVGYRFFLNKKGLEGEPFVALNETFVVYAEHTEVISALRKMHEDIGSDRQNDNLVSLVKAMAKAANVDIHQLNDKFFLKPFTPGHS